MFGHARPRLPRTHVSSFTRACGHTRTPLGLTTRLSSFTLELMAVGGGGGGGRRGGYVGG
jgi:hypothetical protein